MFLMSVVIPSYRSKKTIGLCLRAILNQSLGKDQYEIIVVDSSDDGTAEYIRENFQSVKLIHLSQKALPGEARNRGVIEAAGDLFVFIDSDCVAKEDLLEKMWKRMKDTKAPGVGGSVENGTPSSILGWVEYLINFKDFTPKTPPHFTSFIPSCNLCLRRRTFERFGPFPRDHFPGEDRVLNWYLSQGGGPLFFDPDLQVSHLHRTRFRSVMWHQFSYGRAFVITRSQFPLPGQFFVSYPVFSVLLPLGRWMLGMIRVRGQLKLMFLNLLLFPLILSALVVWVSGFWYQLLQGAEKGRVVGRGQLHRD